MSEARVNMSTQQKARAEAAEAAKAILSTRVSSGAFGAQTKVDVMDIHSLASWILTGADPFPITKVKEVPEAAARLMEAFDLLFDQGGHAKADEFRGINLWVKASYMEDREPELALWMKKLHSVLNPADVAAYERTSIEELRERLTGEPAQPPELVACPNCREEVENRYQHKIRHSRFSPYRCSKYEGYPPADVDGVPWQDADPDRTKDLTGEPVADAVSGDTLHNDGDGEPADG